MKDERLPTLPHETRRSVENGRMLWPSLKRPADNAEDAIAPAAWNNDVMQLHVRSANLYLNVHVYTCTLHPSGTQDAHT